MNYFELKRRTLKRFQEVGIDEMSDFDWICCEVTGKRRSEMVFIKDFSETELKQINEFVEKRLQHIPLAYILGKTNFYGLDFVVTRDVLIPRLDTEVLVEEIIQELKNYSKPVEILDIGTGSGAIAITLAKNTNAKVTAVDISPKALAVAKKNAVLNKVDVKFIESDLFENLGRKKFDIIVSNPPYIESEVIDELMPEVKDFEPILALDGGKDGLQFYRRIVDEADKHLKKNGKLFFEIGYNQWKPVGKIMIEKFKNIFVIKDYQNNDRVVVGEKRWLKD